MLAFDYKNARRPRWPRTLLLMVIGGALFLANVWAFEQALQISFPNPDAECVLYAVPVAQDGAR